MNSIRQSIFELESRNKKNVDGQTDVGHIHLIAGLVTRNPPKKQMLTPLCVLFESNEGFRQD